MDIREDKLSELKVLNHIAYYRYGVISMRCLAWYVSCELEQLRREAVSTAAAEFTLLYEHHELGTGDLVDLEKAMFVLEREIATP